MDSIETSVGLRNGDAGGAGHGLGEALLDLGEHRDPVRVRRVRHHLGDRDAERLLEQRPVVARGVQERLVGGARQPDRRVADEGRDGAAGAEEQLGPGRAAEEDVVVEVDEVLGQSGDPVQRRSRWPGS